MLDTKAGNLDDEYTPGHKYLVEYYTKTEISINYTTGIKYNYVSSSTRKLSYIRAEELVKDLASSKSCGCCLISKFT